MYSITVLAIGVFGGFLVGIATGIALAVLYIRSRVGPILNAETTQRVEVSAVLRKLAAVTADPVVKRVTRTPRARH